MYPVAAIGLLVVILGILMIASPTGWSRAIIAFERKRYFHVAEILSRLAIGTLLVIFAGQTLHPALISGAGYLLVAVAAGLLLAGPRRHRAFAIRSASFTPIFRPAGFVSLALGAFIVYTAVASTPFAG